MKEATKKNAETDSKTVAEAAAPGDQVWKHIGWIALATVAVIPLAWVPHTSSSPWFIVSIPIALAVWTLVVLRHGYFLGREWRWRRRQQEEREAEGRLEISPGVKKPRDFELVDTIDQAQHALLPKLPDYQGRYRAAGLSVALLPSLALLCLALQVLLLPHGTPWGIGLVAAEALLLGWLIFLVWTSSNPSLPWVRSRFRAELLRREQYLCLVAVGPSYLGLSAEEANSVSCQRVKFISEAGFEDLKRLLPMATQGGGEYSGDSAWIDAVWNHPNSSAVFPDLLERMQCYLHYRIGKQMMYFSLGGELNERGEIRATRILKGVVVLAVILAVTHAVMLACETGQGEHSDMSVLVTLLAFLLPPISASLLAIQNLFDFHALVALYQRTHRELLVLEMNLRQLIGMCGKDLPDEEDLLLEKQFQALVLRTEQTLTCELEKWTLLVFRSEYEVGA